MEVHIIEAGVVQAILVFLHLGLNATDSSIATLLAPVSVLSPVHAGPLQCWVAAAAKLDVVNGRVVTKQTLMGLHTKLERGEHTSGAVLGLGPVTEAGQESRNTREGRKKKSGKDPRCGLETLDESQDIPKSERLICNLGRSSTFISPLNMMGICQSPASCCFQSTYFILI